MRTPLHRWDLTPIEAVRLQQELASQIVFDCRLDARSVVLVGGVDVSVKRAHDGQEWSQAAVVIMALPDFEIVDRAHARLKTPFPYISGLLTFREGPVLIAAMEKLKQLPDVFIFDGMGRAHPRRIGIASHMGLWLNHPTIGCGKTHLIGEYQEPAVEKGAYSVMTHHGEVIGAALRTRSNTKPVFVSSGHLIDLESSIELTMICVTRYRLPEPIRAAHRYAGEFDV